MGGLFGVATENCFNELFYGTDYHSHLATEYGGLAIFTKNGIFNPSKYSGDTQFKSKFKGVSNFKGH